MLAGFVLGGMRGRSTQVKIRPNQGVWLSLRNAVVAAIVLSVTLAALSWVIRDVTYAWQIGVLSAVIAVSPFIPPRLRYASGETPIRLTKVRRIFS